VADKKLFTRAEFEDLRLESAKEMHKDQELWRDALDVLVRADHYRWIHQTNWLGEPALNLPQDMFALQEIIFKTRPQFIIELGVAWGGSLLFYSTLMEVLGGERIIGVDIYIPEDLRERLSSHGNLSKRLTLINGSSIEQDTQRQVKSIVGDCREVMVVLDSYHTHDHVLKELHLYSSFVGKGSYLICGDTVVEDIPEQEHRSRPWGPGNNPKTALRQFLQENDRFEVDDYYDQKLLFTCSPGGYLKAIKA
jgi:cephalosporin hydroxylase